MSSSAEVAWGRIWLGSSPWWWQQQPELYCLRLWPSRRAHLGWLLQSAHAFGMPRSVLATGKWSGLGYELPPQQAQRLADCLAEQFVQGTMDPLLARMLAVEWTTELPREVGVERTIELARRVSKHWKAEQNNRRLSIYGTRFLATEFATTLETSFGAGIAQTQRLNEQEYWPRWFAREVNLPEEDLLDLSCWIHDCSWYWSARAFVTQMNEQPECVRLMAEANRRSFGLTPRSDINLDGDRMWHRLARHVARISTEADKQVLADIVNRPQAHVHDEVLRYGIEFWVRGDILLNDGQQVRLEELVDDPGPMLEDMPPELVIEPS